MQRCGLLQYLEDLDCPLEFDAASAERPDIMDWLLHYAVDLVYEDNGGPWARLHV